MRRYLAPTSYMYTPTNPRPLVASSYEATDNGDCEIYNKAEGAKNNSSERPSLEF